MLKLSRKSEYGLIALKYMLNRSSETPCSAREIAGRYKIPEELMAKILQKLAKDGVIVSTQGVRGGYVLALTPAEISVAQIVECLDGPIGIVDCFVNSGEDCECVQFSEGVCNIHDPFMQIQLKFKSFLSGISLADLNESTGHQKLYHIAV